MLIGLSSRDIDTGLASDEIAKVVEPGTDLMTARQQVADETAKMAAAIGLPAGMLGGGLAGMG